jgi:hypothetical protein
VIREKKMAAPPACNKKRSVHMKEDYNVIYAAKENAQIHSLWASPAVCGTGD